MSLSAPWEVSAPPSEREVHLRDYVFLVLKRRWLITSVLATVLCVTLVASLLQTPTYRATTLVQVDRGKLNLVQDVMVDDVRAGYEEFYATQQRVLRSRTLAHRVMGRRDFWDHPALQIEKRFWNRDAPADREAQHRRYRRPAAEHLSSLSGHGSSVPACGPSRQAETHSFGTSHLGSRAGRFRSKPSARDPYLGGADGSRAERDG